MATRHPLLGEWLHVRITALTTPWGSGACRLLFWSLLSQLGDNCGELTLEGPRHCCLDLGFQLLVALVLGHPAGSLLAAGYC